jgi:peptidoglycan/xylan/chitin deacetylase (PgdA/CDA1 family)
MKHFQKNCIALSLFSMSAILLHTGCQQSTNATTPAVVTEAAPTKPTKLPAEKHDSTARVVYLTFDDGPLPGSEAINRLATEKKFKASVFVVGKHTKNGKNSMRVMRDFMRNPYIDVCNHSYTHANNQYDKFYKQADSARADFHHNQQELGLENKIIRLPGRQLWAMQSRDLYIKASSAGKTAEGLRQDGYNVIGWDLEWHGKGLLPKETPEELMTQMDELFNNDRTWTRNNLVILAHDPMFSKPEGQVALVKLVDLIRAKGYIIENIRHYPEKDYEF